jgi:hypothetical protein
MGPYPRREKAERKARERADSVPVPDCQALRRADTGDRFRYNCDRIICEACEEQNPQSRHGIVPRAYLRPREVQINFVSRPGGFIVQAMPPDCRTMLPLQGNPATLCPCSPTSVLLSSSWLILTTASADGDKGDGRDHSVANAEEFAAPTLVWRAHVLA